MRFAFTDEQQEFRTILRRFFEQRSPVSEVRKLMETEAGWDRGTWTKLNQEMGLTVLLVEQKLPFARRLATEFCILEKGRRVAGGPIGALTDDIVRAHLSV